MSNKRKSSAVPVFLTGIFGFLFTTALVYAFNLFQPTIYQTLVELLSNVNEEHIINGRYEGNEEERIMQAAAILSEGKIFIDELPDFSLQDIENHIKKNITVILLSVIATLLLIIAIILLINNNAFKFNNSSSNSDKSKENIKELKKGENNYIEEKEEPKQEESKEEETNDILSIPPVNTEEKSEVSLLSYFENEEKNITNSSSLKDKAKTTFINIIDFIFYDKEIKGYTFKEITSSAKLKIIDIALKVDNKIDSYFPDYKENIKDKYNGFKGKLALKYLEVSTEFCDNNTNVCNQAKEDFNTMKESFGFTFDLLKEIISSGSAKVKDLYENWKEK